MNDYTRPHAEFPFTLPPNLSKEQVYKFLDYGVRLSRTFEESKKLGKALAIGSKCDLLKWCKPWKGGWLQHLSDMSFDDLKEYAKDDGGLALEGLSGKLLGKVMFPAIPEYLPKRADFKGGTRHRSAFCLARILAAHDGGMVIVVSEGGTLDYVTVLVDSSVYLYNGQDYTWALIYDESDNDAGTSTATPTCTATPSTPCRAIDFGTCEASGSCTVNSEGLEASTSSTTGLQSSKHCCRPQNTEPVDLLIVFASEGLGDGAMRHRCDLLLSIDRRSMPLSWDCINTVDSDDFLLRITERRPAILHVEPGEEGQLFWPRDDDCKDEGELQRQIIIMAAHQPMLGAIINFGMIDPSAVEKALKMYPSHDSLSIIGWSLTPSLKQRNKVAIKFYNCFGGAVDFGKQFRSAYARTSQLLQREARALFLTPQWHDQKSDMKFRTFDFFITCNSDEQEALEVMFEAQKALTESLREGVRSDAYLEEATAPRKLDDGAWMMEVVLKTSPNVVDCLPEKVTAASLRDMEELLQKVLPGSLQKRLRVRRFKSLVVCMPASAFQELIAVLVNPHTAPLYLPLPEAWGGGEVLLQKVLPGACHWLTIPYCTDEDTALVCSMIQNFLRDVFHCKLTLDDHLHSLRNLMCTATLHPWSRQCLPAEEEPAVAEPLAESMPAEDYVSQGPLVFQPEPRSVRTKERDSLRSFRSDYSTSAASSSSRRGASTALDSSLSKTIDVRAFLPIRTDAKITDRYNIDARQFAAGGHAKVFKAKDRHFPDMCVVIKKLVCHNEERTAAFRKEVNIMRELDHPNICKVLETYEEGRFMYIVMESCEGGELFDRIEDGLAESTAAEIIQQICSALFFAHNRKIAHRDLKPENVCFCKADPSDLQVKVIDWGLGFHFDAARMKSAVGSLAYTAPEVLEAEVGCCYGSECDLWSLGAMTYVMLCARPPFWGSVQKQLNCMKMEKFPMSKPPWPEVSDNAKDFISALLRCAPENRLPIEQALNHPWFDNLKAANPDAGNTAHVLTNLRSFSNNSHFFSICVASAARQLDHKHLQHIYHVFKQMDTNFDGTIDLSEMRRGFQEFYGEDSEEVKKVEETFTELDLDGSGCVDYTEFCAAAMGEKMLMQENVLWSAFKAFDVRGDDGKITKAEIVEVLKKADVRQTWSAEVCDEVAQDIVDKFDKEGVGYLDFQAWLGMMKAAAWGQATRTPSRQVASGVPEAEWVVWVSVDPREAQLACYPGEIAWMLEDGWQRGEDVVALGEKFFGARVYFKGKNGNPFQRTNHGLRDVRRVKLAGQAKSEEVLTFLISGKAPEYRIQDTDTPAAQERRLAVSPENAVNASDVIAAIQASRPRLEALGVSWWQNNAFVSDLENSIRQGIASSSASMRSWWQRGTDSSNGMLSGCREKPGVVEEKNERKDIVWL